MVFTCDFTKNLVPGFFYDIYITASNDDPSEYANFTIPMKFEVQIPKPNESHQRGIVLEFGINILLTVLMLFASLMY